MRTTATPDMTDVEKLAALEKDREQIKAYNASCRRGSPNSGLLAPHLQRELEVQVRIDWLNEDGSFRGYVLRNLGSKINRLYVKVQAERLRVH